MSSIGYLTYREKIHLQNAFVILEDHGHNFVHIVGSSELFYLEGS